MLILLFLILISYQNLLFAQDSTSIAQPAKPEEQLSVEEKEPEAFSRFSFSPSLGFTYFSSSKTGGELDNVQWLTSLQSSYVYEGPSLQFSGSLLAQYGQIHSRERTPDKVQDNLILTLTPSITLIKKPHVRLFLETTAETDIGDGYIGDKRTTFLDPLFLYQTLFVGQKQFVITGEASSFQLTYGLGYAFQQTFRKGFKVDTLDEIQSNNTFESGVSAILQLDADVTLFDKLKFRYNMKGVALSKDNFSGGISSSRASLMIITGLYYGIIGVDYNFYLVYDKNLSARRELDQSLLLTFKIDL